MKTTMKRRLFFVFVIFFLLVCLFDVMVRNWVADNPNHGVENYIESYNLLMSKKIKGDIRSQISFSATYYLFYIFVLKSEKRDSLGVSELGRIAYHLEDYTSQRKGIGVSRLDIKPFLLFSISSKEERRILDSVLKNTQISKQSPP